MGLSTSQRLRDANLARALSLVHEAPEPVTRAQLSRDLDVSRATAGTLVDDLCRLGLLTEAPAPASGRRGRPTVQLLPAPAGPVAVVAEIAVGTLRVAEIGVGGRLHHRHAEPLADAAPDRVMTALRELIEPRLERLGARCFGIGVAVYGLVDKTEQHVLDAPNLGWTDVPLGQLLGDEWGLPVHVDNDTKLTALAEARRGAGTDLPSFLLIHSAVGVGGAQVSDGRVQRGRAGLAGEFGHLPFGRRGLACRCGARGCWETEVDERALLAAYDQPVPGAVDVTNAAGQVFRAARVGDARADAAVRHVGGVLGYGLGALTNALDPHGIVLTGHAARLLAHCPQDVAEAMHASAMRAHRDRLPALRAGRLQDDGALLGAAEIVLSSLLDDPRGHTPTPRRRARAR